MFAQVDDPGPLHGLFLAMLVLGVMFLKVSAFLLIFFSLLSMFGG